MFGLSKLELLGIVAGVAILGTAIGVGVIYHKGEKAGEAGVTSAVESATNEATEKARKDKEAADEKVRKSNPDAVIDSTR